MAAGGFSEGDGRSNTSSLEGGAGKAAGVVNLRMLLDQLQLMKAEPRNQRR